MAIRRSERKQWARDTFVGLQNIVAPSFNAELTELDEAGIRLDVRQSIDHGFFATMCACGAGLTLEENKRFVEIARQEAGDELLVGISLFLDNKRQMQSLLSHAEDVGADFALLGFPVLYDPDGADAVYEYASELCESTSLGIVLPAHRERVDLGYLHPSGIPFDAFDRLVDIDNVVAILIGSLETGLISECFSRYRDKVLVTSQFFGMAPMLADAWGLQWTGGWMYEALQSPGDRNAVEFFDLVRTGRLDEAMKLYWHMGPGMAVHGYLEELFKPGASDHYQLRKYYQWCVGGNGGLTRQPHFNLFERQKDMIHDAYEAMGISATADAEELFFTGRSQYSSAI